MTIAPPISLSDSALLAEVVRAAGAERRSTAELLALLAELDRRKLYLGRGYSSLFAFCTRALQFSEPEAYGRITAARAAGQFPRILKLLADGDVTLTTITLLAAHLTPDNHETLLAASRHKNKREVELLVATVDPQPAMASSVRRMPVRRNVLNAAPIGIAVATPDATGQATQRAPPLTTEGVPNPSKVVVPVARRAVVAPIAVDRYLLKVTLSGEAHDKFERIRDLLRHAIPNGDAAAIVERALTALLDKLERAKYAAASRPRASPGKRPDARSRERPSAASRQDRTARHVPADVKRAVWSRDQGRCAFFRTDGRCAETGFLEFHHVVPFAAGGRTTVQNVELRCRAHNAYEADKFFGAASMERRRPPTPMPRTLSGPSPRSTVESRG